MTASIGLDLGGTKLAAYVYASDWSQLSSRRVDTPKVYNDLISAMVELHSWGERLAGKSVPVGVSSAGIIDPSTGRLIANNLCADGHALHADLEDAIGSQVSWLNDGRALALSEARLGAGRGMRVVQAISLGTGLGGGLVVDGQPRVGPSGVAGEVGQLAVPARFDLPRSENVLEHYLSGPGLSHLAGGAAPKAVVAGRTSEFAEPWRLWCGLLAELVRCITVVIDPDIIVLGGGMSGIDGLLDDLTNSLDEGRLGKLGFPPVRLATGGDGSGARGAAFAAREGI